jgi:hypothetical protein
VIIQINDMFRLFTIKDRWKCTFWQLQEWQATGNPEGRWQSITQPLNAALMDSLLERYMCPREIHERFRATTNGSFQKFEACGYAESRKSARDLTPLRATE